MAPSAPDMGEEDRGGLPDLDLDPTRFLSRYYPPRDISPMVVMGEEDRGGLPDPNLSKNWGGLPDLDLDPTQPDFCRDIIPLEISRPWLVTNAHTSQQNNAQTFPGEVGLNLALSLVTSCCSCQTA